MAYTVNADKVGEIRGRFDNTGNATYTSTWIVNFDTPVADLRYVATLPEIPRMFSACPLDSYAQLTKIDPKQDADDPATWLVELEWSRVSKDLSQFLQASPLDLPAKVKWTGRDFERPLIYDVLDGSLVCNSAGEPYDPPYMIDDSRAVAIITVNQEVTPSYILRYVNKINNAPMTVDGVFVDKYCARVRSIEVSEWKVVFGQYYREVQIVLEFRDNQPYPNGSSGVGDPSANSAATGKTETNLTAAGWQILIQDSGMRELKYNTVTSAWEKHKIVDDNGIEVNKPALLNGLGLFKSGLSLPGTEYYRRFNGYQAVDFSVLGIPA